MANNEIKTNAEIYREQRKARLAKAAKKKRSGKGDKIARILVKTLCILLGVAIVLFGAAKIATDILFLPQKNVVAATYGDEEITIAEYNYYYWVLYNQAVSVSQQYDSQYGTGAGAQYYFDTTVSPADQEYTGDDLPETVKTWADYFKYSTPIRAFLIKSLYKEAMSEEAKAAGFEITAAQQTEIDNGIESQITQLQTYATQYDYGLDNYISKVCGKGLTEESYRELLERDSIAELYLDWYQENATKNITEEKINEYYNAHKDDIDVIGLRFFKISYAEATDTTSDDPVYTKDQAKARAEEFASKVTDEASFVKNAITYAAPSIADSFKEDSATFDDTVTKTSAKALSEDFANWAFDATRKANDISVFDFAEQEAYCVVYIVETAHKDTSTAGADVRHLLVQADTSTTDAEGATVTLSNEEIEANFAEAKTEADELFKKWESMGKTEEAFIALVKEHTDDTASAETGGLYEDINSASNYVPEFLAWALEPHEKGDAGIVKTDYGYHIMYYVDGDPLQKWQGDIRDTLSSDSYNAYFEEKYDVISDGVERNEKAIDWTAESIESIINTNIASSASSASYTY